MSNNRHSKRILNVSSKDFGRKGGLRRKYRGLRRPGFLQKDSYPTVLSEFPQ